ncbi:MAG: hypothetical protein ACK443_08265 [Methylococcaceae bacterium]|jgi:hypothetical protein
MAIKKSVSLTRRPRRTGSASHANNEADLNGAIGQESPSSTLVTSKDLTCASPPAANLCGRLLYSSTYLLTYSAVFGALFISRMLPGRTVISRALDDGARAAKNDFSRIEHAQGNAGGRLIA